MNFIFFTGSIFVKKPFARSHSNASMLATVLVDRVWCQEKNEEKEQEQGARAKEKEQDERKIKRREKKEEERDKERESEGRKNREERKRAGKRERESHRNTLLPQTSPCAIFFIFDWMKTFMSIKSVILMRISCYSFF